LYLKWIKMENKDDDDDDDSIKRKHAVAPPHVIKP
jgi:hypothetical protein